MEQFFPDVLGAITREGRREIGTLQCVLGVFPGAVAVGQPFELLVLMQSTIDKQQTVNLSFDLPRRDRSGRRVSFFMPQRQVQHALGPGEVGVLHLPVVAQPPTMPARGYAMRLSITAQAQGTARQIRPRGVGRPPGALTVSPFLVEVLREVQFHCDAPPEAAESNAIYAQVDVIPGQVAPGISQPVIKYEPLWNAQDYSMEEDRLADILEAAEHFQVNFTRATVYAALEGATQDRFAQAGMPLHPGEAIFITKLLTYIFEDALEVEQGYTLQDGRWFQWLCSLMAQDETAADRDPGDLAANELYEGALYDAVLIGLPMIEFITRQVWGSREEHRQHAEKILLALQGQLPMDLAYVYLPLVMAGVILNEKITLRYDNPWLQLDELREAVGGRARLIGSRHQPVFEALNKLIAYSEDSLRRARVPRG